MKRPPKKKTAAQKPATPTKWRRWFALGSGFLILAAVVVVIRRRGEGIKFAEMVQHAQPGWLLLAVVLQVGTYACAAGAWHRVLARQKIHTSILQLIPLGLAKLFMDQVVPSAGLSGTLLVVRALKRRGVPEGASVSAVVVGLLGFYIAYGLALASALLLLWIKGDLSHKLLWIATISALAIGSLVGALLWMSRAKTSRVRRWLMKLPGVKGFMEALHQAPPEALRDRTLLLETTVLQFGIFLLDSATLGVCLLALGATASISGIFAALVIASLVATITIIPSGLGTFDATMLGMLSLVGVTTSIGVGAILLFRGFTLMLPLFPGLWLARKEMKGSP